MKRVRTPIFERMVFNRPVQYAVNAQGVWFRRFYVPNTILKNERRGPWAGLPGHWDAWKADCNITQVPHDCYRTGKYAIVPRGPIGALGL